MRIQANPSPAATPTKSSRTAHAASTKAAATAVATPAAAKSTVAAAASPATPETYGGAGSLLDAHA